MVKVDRQLLIGAQLIAHQGRDGLLVRGAQHKLATMTVVKAHELLAIGIDTTRLTPQLGIDHNGHHELLGAGSVHLVAHDVLDLTNRAPSER